MPVPWALPAPSASAAAPCNTRASNTTDYSGRFSSAASQAYSIDTNSQTVTFASALTSPGGTLAKLGNGTLILTGANSYNTTTITAGTLQIGNGGTSGSLGTGNVTDNGTLAFNRSDSITIGTLISGSTGGLSQIGSGTLTLNTSNTFVGAVTISGGTLSTNNVADTGVASGIGTGANGAITLSGGGTFQYLGGTASTSRLITMSSSATLDASGSGAINFTRTGILAKLVVGTASTTVTLTGSNTGLNALRERISNPSIGTTSLVKNGSGTWDLAAASNTYSGTTTISQGILEVDADAALGTRRRRHIGQRYRSRTAAGECQLHHRRTPDHQRHRREQCRGLVQQRHQYLRRGHHRGLQRHHRFRRGRP